MYGLNGNTIALVIKDVHTGFLDVFPSDTKASDQVYASIQSFLGNARVKTFYSDNARDLIEAVEDLGFGVT